MDPGTLYKVANNAILPFWFLLAAFPRSALTAKLVRSGAISCVIAGFYIFSLSRGAQWNPDGFSTLENLRVTFQNEWFLLAGWLHYLAFDLYVGSTIVGDYVARGGSRLVLVVELFFTLMLGPVGLLLHKARLWIWHRR